MSKLDQPSFYKRAVDTFELPPEKAEKIAAQMVALGVDRDDEYLLLFLATGRIEFLVEALPASIRSAGITLIRDMKKAVSDSLDEKLATLPDGLAKKLDDKMEVFVSSLVKNIDLAVNREAARRQIFRLGGLVIGAALSLIVALGLGYVYGRDTLSSDAAKYSSVVTLEDGGQWMTLAHLNPNLGKILAQNCGPSDGRVVSGGKVCDLTMFVTAPVGTSKGVDYVRLSLAEQANKLGWAGYVFAAFGGVMLTWLGGRLRQKPY